jgi:hypothetical protein
MHIFQRMTAIGSIMQPFAGDGGMSGLLIHGRLPLREENAGCINVK